jgi:CDP-diacylglycerol--glycerol-3-phosphate 3-phosphatidyltransferase
MLSGMDRVPAVPAWMTAVIIGREIAVTGLRAVALGQGVVIAAEELGKYKMIFQMFAIHGLLMHYGFFGIDWHAGGMYFLWISLVLGLWSGVDYHVKVIRQLMSGTAPATP